MTKALSAGLIQAEYDKGKQYKTTIDLYEKVKLCERFYEGDQWNGLKTMSIRPITMNFTRRLFSYFCAMVVSDDISVSVSPFLQDEQAQAAADVIEQSIERIFERQKLKTLNREALRDAGVDGDAVMYFYFDTEAKTGMDGVQGEIKAELLMNTNVIFGNSYSRDVQGQPYILLVRRRPVAQVREEAKKNGVQDWEKITADSERQYKGEDENASDDTLVTEITRLWKENDLVHFMRVCGEVVTQKDTATDMTLYPVAYMSWLTKKNSCHGVRAMEELIPTQIAVNQMWTAVNLHIQGLAFPKVLYNRNVFPDGWNGAPGKAVGVMGDPREAATSIAGGVPLPNMIMDVLDRTISTARDCAGASDAALGNIQRPDNKGAIIAVQQASAAPLELQKLGFYQFVEDYTRILIDMMHAYYGARQVKVAMQQENPLTGETTESEQIVFYDFSGIPVDAMDFNVDIGPASYWSQLARTTTLDALLSAGVITDALDYLERIPDNTIPDKAGLIEKMRKRQESALSQQQQAMQGAPPTAAMPGMEMPQM